MKSNAAVLTEVGKPSEVTEVDVRDPKEGEVLIRYVAAGLCHSDMHLMTRDLPVPLPYVGGHEGAGIIEAVGPGVNRVAKGDHVVCAFIPSCGHCRWGSAVNTGNVQIGDTVIIFGIGGIGANAVQGAAHAGATRIIAVDPLANKGEFAQELGATHAVQSAEEGIALAQDNPAGGADVAIVTVDVVNEQVVQAAAMAVRKNGTIVLTGLARPEALTVHLSGVDLTLNRKHVKGSLFGDCNPAYDIKKMLELYRAGKLKLDELVTKQYTLAQINQGYDDLEAGKNIRGVIIHEG